MAYGRISWIDMLYAAQEAVLKRYAENEDELTASGNHFARLANQTTFPVSLPERMATYEKRSPSCQAILKTMKR